MALVTLLGVLLFLAVASALVWYNRYTHDRMLPEAFEEAIGNDAKADETPYSGFGGFGGPAMPKNQADRRAENLAGHPVRVIRAIDAATFEVVQADGGGEPFTVRLPGIEALDGENRSRCERQAAALNLPPEKVRWYAGVSRNVAGNALSADRQVLLRVPLDGPPPRDAYGNIVGYLEADNRDVAADLLRRGLVTSTRADHLRAAEYSELEATARKSRIGIFGAL